MLLSCIKWIIQYINIVYKTNIQCFTLLMYYIVRLQPYKTILASITNTYGCKHFYIQILMFTRITIYPNFGFFRTVWGLPYFSRKCNIHSKTFPQEILGFSLLKNRFKMLCNFLRNLYWNKGFDFLDFTHHWGSTLLVTSANSCHTYIDDLVSIHYYKQD